MWCADGQPDEVEGRDRHRAWKPASLGIDASVDPVLIIVGALFLIWPLHYRRSMRRIHGRIEARGGDVDRFERGMDRSWIRVGLVAVPALGALLVVAGLLGL